ncbi:MAG: hypothetical protein JWM08_3068 [Candidatus Angelobacter sp.]|jgi:hypothetical protein|nr:hypothetical protein [Candidatus Angelobacter sp.]
MSSFAFILAVLAVWRFTHLLAAEDGPFRMFAWLRRKVSEGFWGTLLDCFYCLSLWIALPFAFLLGKSWLERFLIWPALSALAILLNRFADRIAPDQPIFFEEPQVTNQNIKEKP